LEDGTDLPISELDISEIRSVSSAPTRCYDDFEADQIRRTSRGQSLGEDVEGIPSPLCIVDGSFTEQHKADDVQVSYVQLAKFHSQTWQFTLLLAQVELNLLWATNRSLSTKENR
jgi:hypothetical protein